ncbi:MAG: HNH endonuclease [Candidatus Acidiferrales bacterium]
MQNKKPNAELAWKRLEDVVVPRLGLTLSERAVYYHLLRHSRLEGRRRFAFSIPWLSRGTCLTGGPVRCAVRRLASKGVLRLLQRSKAGHVVEVRLPEEVRIHREKAPQHMLFDLETTDFMQAAKLRQSIYDRERGQCFYCFRHLPRNQESLDHVLPRARRGRNSYRNLVACCLECNSQKGEKTAADHLRFLVRHGRLTSLELNERLRALRALAEGKLKPALPVPRESSAVEGIRVERSERESKGFTSQSLRVNVLRTGPGRKPRGCSRLSA